MRLSWRLLPLLCLVAHSWAADFPGSADLDELPRFPQAEITDYRQEHVAERLYPQDSLRRIGGQLRMDQQVTADGMLTAITYRLPDHHSGLDAFTAAREHLLAEGAELLYWCEGRDCGSSSLWANSIFGKSTLYGPEGNQAYLLARLAEPPERLVALYAITRGNGRPYLQVERLEPGAALGELLPTAGTLLRQLREAGELQLPRLPAEPLADWSALLARTLRMDSALRVTLSGEGAEAWRDALVAEGVRALRIEVDPSSEPGLVVRRLR
ncbi:DUF4892 domain-containing protein [Stutzerimonas azotifigens]|uniref:DUF4892 domain-containing protein n=1 Tax=Stutzerimonas azotifigens TaxID=291995 RepID=UPI0003FD8F98|nr:DUF4892 domain-containing protein [Stutzerimonas azotifigens]